MKSGLSTRFLTSQGWSGFGGSSGATAVRLAVAAVSLMGNSIIGKKKGRKPMLPPCCPLGLKFFLSTIVEILVEILNRFSFKSTAFRLTPFGHHKDSEESIVNTKTLTQLTEGG